MATSPTIPPTFWDGAWRTYVADYGIQFTTLEEAYNALSRFWEPVFAEPRPYMTWHADNWEWS
jgi:hypothetical protein